MFYKSIHLDLASCKDNSIEDIVLFLFTSEIILYTVHQYSDKGVFVYARLLSRVVESFDQCRLSKVLTELAFPVRMEIDFGVIRKHLFFNYTFVFFWVF